MFNSVITARAAGQLASRRALLHPSMLRSVPTSQRLSSIHNSSALTIPSRIPRSAWAKRRPSATATYTTLSSRKRTTLLRSTRQDDGWTRNSEVLALLPVLASRRWASSSPKPEETSAANAANPTSEPVNVGDHAAKSTLSDSLKTGEKGESNKVTKSSDKSERSAEKSSSTSQLPWRTRAWETVKKEAAHYWAGTKLLGKEIKISSKITKKVLHGGSLTRRERRQLRRTTNDLLRLVPFSVFLIIPFMELLLPVALKLFPNMLPSTFEGKLAADEKQRKLLRVRIQMAKFLQETISESGLKAEKVVDSDEFREFFRKVRATGEQATPEDVIKVAKLFHDDVTLDNLSRPQLVSMCRYMNIHAFGTDNFLKHQIRNRLEKIRVDDMMIHAEGVDSLSTKELQQACQSRGIRTVGNSPASLREELGQWIDFHYTNRISGVLLVLSRAFHFDQEEEGVYRSLEMTLSSLPDNLLSEAELDVSGEKASYKDRLEVLEQQQELIEDEAEQEQEETEAREQAKREKRDRLAEEARRAKDMLPGSQLSEQHPNLAQAAAQGAPEGSSAATAAAVAAESESSSSTESETDGRMTNEQLGELAEALSILSAKSSIVKERDELKQLMSDNLASEEESKLNEDEESPGHKADVALNKRVRKMIKTIDEQLESYDEKVGSSLNMIQCNAQGQISLADLKSAMKVIKHMPDDETIDAVCQKLDVDQDGYVVLDHVIDLTQDQGLGIVVDGTAKKILDKGAQIKNERPEKPRKEDIVSD